MNIALRAFVAIYIVAAVALLIVGEGAMGLSAFQCAGDYAQTCFDGYQPFVRCAGIACVMGASAVLVGVTLTALAWVRDGLAR